MTPHPSTGAARPNRGAPVMRARIRTAPADAAVAWRIRIRHGGHDVSGGRTGPAHIPPGERLAGTSGMSRERLGRTGRESNQNDGISERRIDRAVANGTGHETRF